MQQNTTDKMLVDPERGFVMAFFHDRYKTQPDLEELTSYIPGSKYGEYPSPDGYNCKVLVDQNFRMILMVGTHHDGHVITRSEFRPSHLSLLIKDAPEETRNVVKASLKGHLKDLSPLYEAWTNATINTNIYENEHAFEIAQKINASIPPLKASNNSTIAKNDAFKVIQAEYGITKYNSDRPVLVSTGAGPCVILTLYNEQAKQGFLAHIDDGLDLDEISACIFEMRKDHNQPLTAHMIGGWSDTYSMVADIAARLEEQPNIQLVGWRESEHIMSNLGLDSRDGRVFETFNDKTVDEGPLVEERTNRILASFMGQPRPPLCSYHYSTGRNTLRIG